MALPRSDEDISDSDVYVSVNINSLPDEVLEYILLLTSPYIDFKSALQVCKRWYNITRGAVHQYQQQFQKAIAGASDVRLLWKCHDVEAGPTVTERYSHSACYFNKSVYVFGGCTSTSTTFNDLWRFDLEHGRWIRPLATGSYPSPKACASLVTYNDSLLLFGGWSHPTPYTFHQASKFFNQLHIYNPESNRWTQVDHVDSPDGIAGHGASVIGNKMVVFGGYHGHGNSSNNVWVLNVDRMVWTKQLVAEPKPLPRYSHTQVILDDSHILIVGGCGGPNMQFSDVWVLDMNTEPWSWTEMNVHQPDLATQQLWCHPGCKVGDKLIVLGKNNNRTSFDPCTSRTSTKNKLKVANNQDNVAPCVVTAVSNLSLVTDNSSHQHTTGARAGMPSVRPNAMKDRRRQLEALNKYEDRLRAASHQTSSALPCCISRRHAAAGMCIHTLDISEALSANTVSWLPIRGLDLLTAPEEAIFYSLVEGRGELIMFGGIRGDARSLQRGNTTLQPQAVSNDVHFLTFCGVKVR